jgi:hypothetical protein
MNDQVMHLRLDWASHTTVGDGARRLLVKLSIVSGILPATLRIEGVRCPSRDPAGVGSYADIFCGEHDGKIVALKRLREFTRGRDRLRQRRVNWILNTVSHSLMCYISFLGIE